MDPTSALATLERDGELVRGELRPGGTQREWCDPDVLRRLRRASLAVLRQEIEAADARALATFLPSWQGVDRHPAAGAGIDRLREVLVPLQGLALPAEVWERDVLPRRCGAYSPTWMDQLCAGGEVVWVGAGSLGRNSGRVALYFREDAEALGRPAAVPPAPSRRPRPAHDAIRARLAQAPCFFTDLLAELPLAPEELQEALWDLVWAGEVDERRLRAAARAAPDAGARPARDAERRAAPGRRFGSRRGRGARAQVQGRWSLTSTIFRSTGAGARPERRRTTAELLLERYGIVTREQVLAEGVPGGFSALYDALGDLETLGVCRRGYFVEGLGGAQFALPGAVERLRAQRDLDEAPPLVLAATDPAQPYGAALPWPKRDGEVKRAVARTGRRLRRAGRRRARRSTSSAAAGACRCSSAATTRGSCPALEALAAFVPAGRDLRLSLERVDGEPVVGSPWESLLIDVGFRAGPRKLTLSA